MTAQVIEMPEVALTRDEARQVTDRIRHGLNFTWQLILTAYKRRADVALGYASWDEYCEREFETMWLRVPDEQRSSVIQSMQDAGMSTRATAAAVGISKDSVNRAYRGVNRSGAGVSPETRTQGLDGKHYRRDRPPIRPAPEPEPPREMSFVVDPDQHAKCDGYTLRSDVVERIEAIERDMVDLANSELSADETRLYLRLCERVHRHLKGT